MMMMKINRVDRRNDNTPILYNREIDSFAHDVLADYKPGLLREPGTVRFEHFLESYLGVTVTFSDIYSDDPDRPIFGVTAFRGGTLKVFDRENKRVSNMIVRANTVVIDNYVMDSGREGLALFTGLHEAGHLMIHPIVYAPERGKSKLSSMVYCRRESVESFKGGSLLRTPQDWREHQADYFAAALAKLYVPVLVYINEDGKVTPKQIKAGYDGEWVKITKVRDSCRRASLRAGGVGIRYTCTANFNETPRDIYLYDEEGKWFIESGE